MAFDPGNMVGTQPTKTTQIILLYLEGEKYKDIARMVGVTVGRVTSALSRARRTGRITIKRRPPGTSKRSRNRDRTHGQRGPIDADLAAGYRRCTWCNKRKKVGGVAWAENAGKPGGWTRVCKQCLKVRNTIEYRRRKMRVLLGDDWSPPRRRARGNNTVQRPEAGAGEGRSPVAARRRSAGDLSKRT